MESGRIVTNEKTGEQAWWDGQNLTPIRVAPGVNPQELAKVKGISDQPPPGSLPPPSDIERRSVARAEATAGLGMSPEDLRKHGEIARSLEQPSTPSFRPRFPTVERALETAAGPAATAATGFIPGSLPVQMAIGAGTEAAGQLLGGKPLDVTKIGIAAATPPAVRGAGLLLKAGARQVGQLVGKEALAKGGVQKAEQVLGKEAAEQASTKALETAKAVTTPVAQTETGKVVMNILGKKGRIAGEDETAIKTATEILDNAKAAYTAGQPIKYGELFEQAQNMRSLASKARGADKENFINLRNAMLNDLAKVGPEAEQAVTAYRRTASIRDVTEALRGASPGKALRETLADPLVKGTFSKAEEKTLETIAQHITPAGLGRIYSSLGSLGTFAFFQPGAAAATAGGAAVIGALLNSPKVGPVLARSLIGPEGKINAAALPALAQLVRGYMASLPEGVNP